MNNQVKEYLSSLDQSITTSECNQTVIHRGPYEIKYVCLAPRCKKRIICNRCVIKGGPHLSEHSHYICPIGEFRRKLKVASNPSLTSKIFTEEAEFDNEVNSCIFGLKERIYNILVDELRIRIDKIFKGIQQDIKNIYSEMKVDMQKIQNVFNPDKLLSVEEWKFEANDIIEGEERLNNHLERVINFLATKSEEERIFGETFKYNLNAIKALFVAEDTLTNKISKELIPLTIDVGNHIELMMKTMLHLSDFPKAGVSSILDKGALEGSEHRLKLLKPQTSEDVFQRLFKSNYGRFYSKKQLQEQLSKIVEDTTHSKVLEFDKIGSTLQNNSKIDYLDLATSMGIMLACFRSKSEYFPYLRAGDIALMFKELSSRHWVEWGSYFDRINPKRDIDVGYFFKAGIDILSYISSIRCYETKIPFSTAFSLEAKILVDEVNHEFTTSIHSLCLNKIIMYSTTEFVELMKKHHQALFDQSSNDLTLLVVLERIQKSPEVSCKKIGYEIISSLNPANAIDLDLNRSNKINNILELGLEELIELCSNITPLVEIASLEDRLYLLNKILH